MRKFETMKVLAFESTSLELRCNSSSGAIFSVLAEQVLAEGGIVYGAAFNADWNVEHVGIESTEDLWRLRKSKYVESDFLSAVDDACREIAGGRKVLFSGTPCQIGVLKKRVGAEYDNLLSVEVICHGAPKCSVWKRYLDELLRMEGKSRKDILSIDFRDKSTGWETYSFTVKFNDGTRFSELYKHNVYMNMFLADYTIKSGCFNCKFKQPNTMADITIGDLWGMKELMPEKYNTGGTNLVVANTLRGEKALRRLEFIGEPDGEKVAQNNPSLTIAAAKPKDYEEVNAKLDAAISFIGMARRELNDTKHNTIKRLGILTQPLGHNYGGIVQNWALQRVFKQSGVKAVTIKYYELPRFPKLHWFIYKKALKLKRKLSGKWIPEKWEPQRLKEECRNLRRFVRNHIKMTNTYIPDLSLHRLKRYKFNAIVVGSDQVWRPIYNEQGLGYMFCDFVAPNSLMKCIAYSASFGVDNWEFSEEQTAMAKLNISKFSAVSVRERSGRILCNKYLGCNAETVLDPTLLLCSADYDTLLSPQLLASVEDGCMGVYILDMNDNKQRLIDNVCAQLNLTAVRFGVKNAVTGLYPDVEDWLAHFKKSRFIITDSYHGTIFSILYHKPFISVVNSERGSTRFTSLTGMVELSNRLVEEYNVTTLKDIINEPIDWLRVEKMLDFYRDISRSFIETAIGG